MPVVRNFISKMKFSQLPHTCSILVLQQAVGKDSTACVSVTTLSFLIISRYLSKREGEGERIRCFRMISNLMLFLVIGIP